MKTALAASAVLACALVAGAAFAQPTSANAPAMAPAAPNPSPALAGKLGHGRGRFARMDRNGDGKVTREEFIAVSDQLFDRIDAHHTGQIAKADIDAFMAKRQAVEAGRMMRAKTGAGSDHEDKRLDKLSARLANGGALTRQQWDLMSARRFDRLDTAHQGYLTPESLQKPNGPPEA